MLVINRFGLSTDWGEKTLSLRPGDKTALQSNKTIHVLLAIWMNYCGLEISQSIRINENGCEVLSNIERKLFLKSQKN